MHWCNLVRATRQRQLHLNDVCRVPPLHQPVSRPVRLYSTSASYDPPRSGLKPGRLLTPLLFAGGIAGGAYLAYRYRQLSATFPPSLRKPLRAALKAQRSEDFNLAAELFASAYVSARELADDEGRSQGEGGGRALGEEPWLKVSGIGVQWAGLLESQGKLSTALSVYSQVYSDLRGRYGLLSARERLRAVAVAQKIGELAQRAGSWGGAGAREAADQQAEEALTWSVEEILKLTTSPEQRNAALVAPPDQGGLVMSELEMPSWIQGADVGACLEALGCFYAKKGNSEFAVPLLLQSLSFLLPPPPRKTQPTIAARCHAGTIMNNLAQVLASAPLAPAAGPGPSTANPTRPRPRDQASQWALRGLDVAEAAASSAPLPSPPDAGTAPPDPAAECRLVGVVARQNLGMLAEAAGDAAAARRWFREALRLAEQLGFREGMAEASKGLKRLSKEAPNAA